jgi:hypothetical protein
LKSGALHSWCNLTQNISNVIKYWRCHHESIFQYRRCFNAYFIIFSPYGSTASRGPRPHFSRFRYHTLDTPHSVGLLWTSDQLVAKTSTWQHTKLARDRHPCLRWDSNPRSQQASGHWDRPSTLVTFKKKSVKWHCLLHLPFFAPFRIIGLGPEVLSLDVKL